MILLGKIMEHPNQSQPNPIRDHQSLPAVLNSFLKMAILQKMYRRRERPQQQQHCITWWCRQRPSLPSRTCSRSPTPSSSSQQSSSSRERERERNNWTHSAEWQKKYWHFKPPINKMFLCCWPRLRGEWGRLQGCQMSELGELIINVFFTWLVKSGFCVRFYFWLLWLFGFLFIFWWLWRLRFGFL